MKKLLSLLLVVALLCCCVGCSSKPADTSDTTTTTTVTTTTTQKTNVITTKPTSTQVTSTSTTKSNTTSKPTTTTTAPPKANPASDFKYVKRQDGKSIGITEYLGTAKDVVIPATIDGLPVRTIGTCAFQASDITSVHLPDSIDVIGEYAFAFCKQLTSVHFGSGIKQLSYRAFAYCSSLEHIDLSEELIKEHLLGSAFEQTPVFYKLKQKYEQYFLFIS